MKTHAHLAPTLLIILLLGWCTACSRPPAEQTTETPAAIPTLTWTPQGPIILPAVGATEVAPLPGALETAPSEEGNAIPTTTSEAQPLTGAKFIFLSETVPDGSHFDPGESFLKSWTFQNDGTTTWPSSYTLALTGTSPAGTELNSPASIPLGAEVPPGGSIEVAVNLVAPQADGQYTVYYQLTDGNGGIIPDSEMWVSILVGEATVSSGGATASGSGISAELVGAGNQGGAFVVTYCMEMPDSRYWYAWEATLTVNGGTYPPTSGSYDPHGLDTPTRCFSISYGLTVASGTPYQVSIPKVEIDPVQFQEANCARAQSQLFAAYPGLNFTCTSPGFFYSIISLPAGMSEAQAGQLIMDALSNTIYGPWVLEGVAP